MSDLLTHLYVLIPVLDDDKHYWVGDEEVEKLLRHGEGWLRAHAERELITNRYLKHQKRLAREALTRLIGEEEPEAEEMAEIHTHEEEAMEKPISLAEQRMGAVMAALRSSGAKRVLDLGCGEFEFAHPQTVVVTTPNVEYNVKFETLPAGKMRHKDHRFEWTRAEFQSWATNMATRFGYSVRFLPVGPEDRAVGSPTQMGIFTRG